MKGPAILLLLVAALESGCASGGPDDSPSAPPPEPPPDAVASALPPEVVPPTPPTAEVPPPAEVPAKPAAPRRMPEFKPSGIREDWKRCAELDSALRGAKTLDAQTAAKEALADHLAGFPARWEGKDVPAPEACYYAVMLQKCRLFPEAAQQARRYIEVAPGDSPNYLNAHPVLICSLAQAGDYAGAEAELKSAVDTVYRGRTGERRVVEETIANAMVKGGRLDLAVEYFRSQAETLSDVEAAVLAVDCYLRLGRTGDAAQFARRMVDLVTEGKRSDRAKVLVQQVDLVGKPAPGFAGTRWWKGEGGPVADADLKGKVTVVFSWNMKAAWNVWFFERLNRMVKDYAGRPVRFVGVSRLAHYDPVRGMTDPELADEEELVFYDMWKEQYAVTFPLAVGGFQETALVDAWAAHVVPYYVVVGKDGVIAYVRTGKNEEHFAVLREMVDRALER